MLRTISRPSTASPLGCSMIPAHGARRGHALEHRHSMSGASQEERRCASGGSAPDDRKSKDYQHEESAHRADPSLGRTIATATSTEGLAET